MNPSNVAILGTAGTWHSQALTDAFQRRAIQPALVDPTRLTAAIGSAERVTAGDISLSELDLLLVREVPGGSLEQVIFRMDALHQLENGGVRLVNSPYAIEKMVDKYYTLSLLQAAGLNVPETRVSENFNEAMSAFEILGCDVVVKPLFGSRGIGMVRVNDVEIAGRVFKALQLGGYVFYLQKFIPHRNRDMRVLIAGGECVAGMERIADSWKTNLAAGARAQHMDLTAEVIDASLRIARTLGADLCGVDLLRSEDGELYVIEANSMPSWQGLQQVTCFDIADRIVEACLRATR